MTCRGIEYGIRYGDAPAFWHGRGEKHVGVVSDGSVEAAEFAAHTMLALGFRGVQVVRRFPYGEWELVRKVNPVREIARWLTCRGVLAQCVREDCGYVEWVMALPQACPHDPGDPRHVVRQRDPQRVVERLLETV